MLVLDEPSAALDPIAERRVIDGYRDVMRGRTVIIISHRFEVIRSADFVVVLDGTSVVESGPPSSLISERGPFAKLFGADDASTPSVTWAAERVKSEG